MKQPPPLVSCHECDGVYERQDIPPGARADCVRCGALLYKHVPDSLNRSLALYFSTLVMMGIANTYPFITMQAAGIKESSLVTTGGTALLDFGMAELGLVVFLTSVAFPLICVLGMLYLLVPLRFGNLPVFHGEVFRIVRAAEPWSLLSVFMLGTLIAIVKLQSMASVTPGLGMFGFVAMLILYSAARANFDSEVIWQRSRILQATAADIQPGVATISCHACGLIRGLDEGYHVCPRCGATMHRRIVGSVERTGALLISAAIMLIPANIYPVMTVKKLGQGAPDTILSGVVKLIEAGMFGLALIVLFASIVVPVLKLTALGFLLYSVRRRSNWRPRDRTLLYRVTEVVGAWSMVDVFLVGLLSGLVSLGLLATIEPGVGATFFAGAVILTMLAAQSFDPRLIWDHAGPEVTAAEADELADKRINKVPVT